VNEKFLHISHGLNKPFPSPDIPEELAWEEMVKLLDEREQKVAPLPPNRNNSNWKYGLLLLFITGIFFYLNRNKLREALNINHPEKVNYKKLNNEHKIGERNVRVNDSINNSASNNPALQIISSQSGKNADPVVQESPSPHFSIKTKRIITGEIKTGSNKIKTKSREKGVYKKIPDSRIDSSAENISAGNKENRTPDTCQSKNSEDLKIQPVISNKTGKKQSMTPNGQQEEKKSKRIALSAGLGLNQFFTIGSQQHSGYNSGGTVGAVSDYIPVPFIRWNISKNLYLQLEGQINTPQYTKQLLAKHEIINDTSRPGQVTENNSVYINKLFYFNIPLSINYSLFQNFYAGAGLQFSQLTNGVGLFEGQEYSPLSPDTLSNSKYASIKEDPVYKEIKTIEWRILFDANYQWQNLILGVRYNQALTNFINVRISSTQVTQARNSSIQLYLRYILWKNKKTKELFAR